MKKFTYAILVFLVAALLTSCKNKKSKPPVKTDTPTTGHITISADESFAPVVKDEANNFMAIYHQAKIDVNFKPEPDVVADLLNNKVPLIIIARSLDKDELSHLRQDYPPRQIKIGMDAVVFIVNRQNPDSNLRYNQIVDILSGKISDWKQINSKSSPEKISLIFDNRRSGIVRYLGDEVLNGDTITSQSFAMDSNAAVFNYVENNPAAIGVMGVSWIIGQGDSIAENFLRRVRVVSISNPDSSGTEVFYRPFHEELMRRQYPFLRNLYIISREEYAGLGTGFATYVASDEGQTIVERSGLVPAKQPLRIIELKNEF